MTTRKKNEKRSKKTRDREKKEKIKKLSFFFTINYNANEYSGLLENDVNLHLMETFSKNKIKKKNRKLNFYNITSGRCSI